MVLSTFLSIWLDVPRPLLLSAWAILLSAWPLSILLVWGVRSLVQEALRAARRGGLDHERVLIVGASDYGLRVLDKIFKAPDLGYRVVGFVDNRATPLLESSLLAPVILGPLPMLGNLIEEHDVRSVIVADPGLSHGQLLDVLSMCDKARVNLKIFPDLFQLVVQEVSASELGGLPLLPVRDVGLRGWNLLVKRGLDVVLAAALLVLLSPTMLLVAAAVRLTSRGPVFFIQERVGVDGRPFPCVKFRTMVADAEAESGPVWARPHDPRTTRVGRILRQYSIDELPQLVNVLAGDMSLVGPRPERPYFVEQFSRLIPRYEQRHQEKAGVTGWAQVNGLRGQTPIEERTLYDLFYVEHWSPGFDLKILLKTIGAVIRGRNAY
jgi:exopolysaccharide biosynthesis polyprenyl glycosylphosphotransferase